MATTTPNFGWTVPTSTDLVKDGATAIETLGDGIDASFVDLKGGTTGQYLSKASGTDLDFAWATPAAGALVFIAGASPSGASAVNFNSCFTSTYQNYVIYFNLIGTTTANLCMRLRDAGSDRTASNYDYFGQSIISTGTSGAWFGAAGNLWYPNKISSTRTTGNIQIFNPKETSTTTGNSQSTDAAATDRYITMGFTYSASASNDGFSLFPDAGTFTGTVRVYGIANS
jgi:hypothetical protein